jgi:outer membrane receptor protein involved in Fe transport
MIWEGIQLQASDPNIFTLGIVNFPEAELNGLEAHLSILPSDGWDIGATIGWNTAEISEDATLFPGSDAPTSVTKGTELPIMPDLKGSLSLQYTFLNNEIWGAQPFVRLDHTYNGEATSSLEGIQSIVFVNPVRTLDPYNITDIRFGLEADGWSASLFVDNVSDERAEQFFNDRWAQTRQSINRPLTVGVTYRKHFR